MATKKTKAKKQKKRFDTLHDLFVLKLNSLYYVEDKLAKALPKMTKAASDPDLRDAFAMHLEETKEHARRLEEAMASIGEKPKKEAASGIDGLIEDSEWVIKNVKDRAARDAVLIAAAQYVENYERAGYGTAREWARLMGHSEAEMLLDETLREEEAANNKLTTLAEGGINESANMEEPVMVM
jgi:ferritin-like metal-binding protein YciE